MNSPSPPGSENHETPKNVSPITRGYASGRQKFEELLRGTYNEIDDTGDEVYTLAGESLRNRAIGDCLGSLEHTGIVEEQLIKIHSLLLLVKLTPQEDMSTREEYFYRAVRIALQYLGSDLGQKNRSKTWAQDILHIYVFYINMKLVDLHKSDSAIIHIMYDSIIKNALDKRKDILETAAKTTQYLAGISDYTQIIMKIEDAFGPCRLLIISEESSIILTSHRIDPELPDTILEQSSGYKYLIVVEAPNGKSRKYSIIIDRGTPEKLNQLKPEHLETIINPMIRRHIQAKENALIKFVNDYATGVIECEKNMYMPLVRPDYSEFISSVIEQSSDPGVVHELREDPDYRVHAIQAIDICRAITLARDTSDLPQIIDTILGGKINRKVLSMVQAILLSRNETMNGSGYPFGLTRKKISLITRLYVITRLYEAKKSMVQDHIALIQHLTECNKGGYMDPDIFDIFLSKIITSRLPIIQLNPTDLLVTAYRSIYYTRYLDRFFGLVELITQINNAHDEYYSATSDTDVQKKMVIIINKFQRRIRELANFTKLLLVTRHGDTPSDVTKGSPGNNYESLTQGGETSSSQKGESLAGLNIRVITSPLVRAIQTATIIMTAISAATKDLLQQMSITVEGSFINPKKDRLVGRDDSLIAMIAEDDTSTLRRFLTELISSANEGIDLFVVHRESGRSLMAFLGNLFDRKAIHATKIPFGENDIYELLFRGDRVIEGEELKDKGLLFSRTDWRKTIAVVNTITQKVFGDTFYHIDHPVNPITVHGQFFDYIDLKNETTPESMSYFVRQLDTHPTTQHFSRILRYEGLLSAQASGLIPTVQGLIERIRSRVSRYFTSGTLRS